MRPGHDQFAGLRGILAIWIVSGHMLLNEVFHGIYNAGFATHEDFGQAGLLILLRFLGVDLFFMLSGLGLTLHYFDKFGAKTTGRDIDRFYVKRIKRIWPMHAATIGLIGLYQLVGIPHPISSGIGNLLFDHAPRTLLLNLVLMNGWGVFPVASWNEPAWSLSITFLIYVIFPNLLLTLKRIPAKVRNYWLALIGLVLAYALIREFAHFTSHSDGTGGITRGVFFAAMGSLTAMIHRVSKTDFWARRGLAINLLFIAMVLVWTYGFQFPLTLFHLTYAPLLLAIMRGKYRLLPENIAQWLGSRSFALFMTQYPALLFVHFAFGHALGQWAAEGALMKAGCYVFAVTWCLMVAEAAYRLFDRPFAR